MFDASALVRALGEPGEPTAYEWLASASDGRVEARVPDLVFAETANALSRYVRAGAMTGNQADERLGEILDAPLESVPLRLLSRQALALAVTRGVTVHDACYLVLALGYDAVLVTADRELAEQADRSALLPEVGPPLD